jgi:hypothetical protein
MAITSETARNEYIGNGVTTTFSFTFKVFSEDDLEVILASYTTDGDGNNLWTEETLVKDTDYAVALGSTDLTKAHAGTITLTGDAPEEDVSRLIIRRKQPFTQTADLKNASEFFAKSHENVFDKITMMLQTAREEVNTAIKIHPSDSSYFDPVLPPGAANNPNSVITINATGDGLEWGPTVTDLSDAAGAAAAAEASAIAAAASELAASTSVTEAEVAEANTSTNLSTVQDIYNAVKYEVSTTITDSTTIEAESSVIRVDPSGGAITLTLPASSAAADLRMIFKNVTSSVNGFTIQAAGSDLIEDSSTLDVPSAYGYAGIVSSGDGVWLVIS